MIFGLFKSLDEKVEEDKETLIAKLKTSDILTLIIEMGNNNPISKNIVKKQKRQPVDVDIQVQRRVSHNLLRSVHQPQQALAPRHGAATLREPVGTLDQPAIPPPQPALDFCGAGRPRLQRLCGPRGLCVRYQGAD